MKERTTKPQGIIDAFGVNFISGLFTGTFSAAAFNPWDRALYLSVKNKTYIPK